MLHVAVQAFHQRRVGVGGQHFQRQAHAGQRRAQVVRHTGQQGGARSQQLLNLCRHEVEAATQGHHLTGACFGQRIGLVPLTHLLCRVRKLRQWGHHTPREQPGQHHRHDQPQHQHRQQGQHGLAGHALGAQPHREGLPARRQCGPVPGVTLYRGVAQHMLVGAHTLGQRSFQQVQKRGVPPVHMHTGLRRLQLQAVVALQFSFERGPGMRR